MQAETVQIHTDKTSVNELDEPIWSLISFERIEAADLDHQSALRLMNELDSKGVAGLCIVTSEAARRIKTPK